MELNWELNALEETDVVSLVLLLVTRSVGDILVSYLCLQLWKNCSLNVRNYYYTEKVPLSLVSRQSVLLIKVSERSKADRRICRQALGRKQMGFAPPLPFLFFCPSPLNFDSFNSKYFHCA